MASALIAYLTITWLIYYRLFHFVKGYNRLPSLKELISTPLPINIQIQGLVLTIGAIFSLSFLYQVFSGTLENELASVLFGFLAWSLYMFIALRRVIKSLSARSTA